MASALRTTVALVVTSVCCLVATTACGVAPTRSAGASTATAVTPAVTPSSSAAVVHAVTRTGTQRHVSCTGPVSLVTSTGHRIAVSPSTHPVLRVRVGTLLHVVAPGRCGTEVQAGAHGRVLRSSGGHRPLIAAEPGTAVLTLTYPMCADEVPAHPACQGGIDLAGQVTVTVTVTAA